MGRASGRKKAKENKPVVQPERGASFDNRVAFVWGLIVTVVLLFKHNDVIWTSILLFTLWIALIFAFLRLSPIQRSGSWWVKSFVALIVTSGVVWFGFNVWPNENYFDGLADLTNKRRQTLVDKLSAIEPTTLRPRSIPVHIMCPTYDEADCSLASPFVSIFEEAGWRVINNTVDRVLTGIPHPGLYFVLYSPKDKDLSKPDEKVYLWVPVCQMEMQKILEQELHLKSDLVTGKTYPPNEIGVYFGSGLASQ